MIITADVVIARVHKSKTQINLLFLQRHFLQIGGAKKALKAKSEGERLNYHFLWRWPVGLKRGTKYQTVKVSQSWGPMSSLLISQKVMKEYGSVHYFGKMALANSISCCCRKYTDLETNCRYPNITTVPSNNIKYKFKEQQETNGGLAIYLTHSLN